MRRFLGVVLGLALPCATACGDDKTTCGTGTEDDGTGTCVAIPTTPTCTDGTILNPTSHACDIDPASCQGGTVLVNHQCMDPTAGLFPDVQEGAEPNGFGLAGEPSSIPAGSFTLKPIGGPGVILHGTIAPRPDRDDDGQPEPDYDAYLVDVTGPTLLGITVDGVHGLAGGFLVRSDVPALGEWIRFGVNLTGDTAKRQVYLPSAGRYAFVIADTRSLTLGSAVGGATSEYYVTIDQLARPAPTPLALAGGRVTTTFPLGPDEVRFFTAPMDIGLDEVSLSTASSLVTGALVVSVGAAATDIASERKAADGDLPASTVTGGIDPTDTTVIAIDAELATATAPTSATLSISTHSAVPFSLTGGSEMRPAVASAPASLDDLALFYFDAAAAGDLIGLDVTWNTPVDGVLFDEHGHVASPFSWDPVAAAFSGFYGGFGNATWDGYRGVFRAPAAGRYYVGVTNRGAAGSIAATSTVSTLTATPIALGTPLSSLAPNAFGVRVFDYPGNAFAWQRVELSASASSGGAAVQLYDANATAGRLGDLVLRDGGGLTTRDPGDGVPLLAASTTAGSTGGAARIMRGGPQHLLAIASTGSGAGTFDLAIAPQVYTDDGTHQGPFSISHTAQPLDSTTFRQLYFLRTDPNNIVTVTAHPVTTTLDLEIASLAADESTLAFADAGGPGTDEVLRLSADARGYVAIQIEAVGAVPTGQFDVTLDVASPYYATTSVAAPWASACPGGTDLTPADRDDGMTGPVALPAGFDFFALPVAALRISTNGWLTFDTTTPIAPSASRTEQRMPSGAIPNRVVAAYWDDLDQVQICTRMVGTRFVVEWRGALFASPRTRIATQAILDTSDDSITLVYAPYHEATGASAAAGAEDAVGGAGTTVFYRLSAVTPGSATRLAHP